MLELTRKVGEQVYIGDPVVLTLTIIGMHSSRVSMQVVTAKDERVYGMRINAATVIHIPNQGRVTMSLLSVDRGEARIAFDAPRTIKIERPDR